MNEHEERLRSMINRHAAWNLLPDDVAAIRWALEHIADLEWQLSAAVPRCALAQLRHLYDQMVNGHVKDCPEAARGLLGPAIAGLEGHFDGASEADADALLALWSAEFRRDVSDTPGLTEREEWLARKLAELWARVQGMGKE